MAFRGSRVVFPAIDSVLLGFTGFYWVLLGFTGFFQPLQKPTGFYWVSPSYRRRVKTGKGKRWSKKKKFKSTKKQSEKKSFVRFFFLFFSFFFFGLRFRFAEERNTPALSTKRTSSK